MAAVQPPAMYSRLSRLPNASVGYGLGGSITSTYASSSASHSARSLPIATNGCSRVSAGVASVMTCRGSRPECVLVYCSTASSPSSGERAVPQKLRGGTVRSRKEWLDVGPCHQERNTTDHDPRDGRFEDVSDCLRQRRRVRVVRGGSHWVFNRVGDARNARCGHFARLGLRRLSRRPPVYGAVQRFTERNDRWIAPRRGKLLQTIAHLVVKVLFERDEVLRGVVGVRPCVEPGCIGLKTADHAFPRDAWRGPDPLPEDSVAPWRVLPVRRGN